MSRHSITLPQIASWDLVVVSSGVILLVVPHSVDPNRLIAADDGIVLDGARPVHLMRSERAVPYVRCERRLIVVRAGGRKSTQKVVPILIHNGSVHARNHNDQPAAA